jgi:hypothetical protein
VFWREFANIEVVLSSREGERRPGLKQKRGGLGAWVKRRAHQAEQRLSNAILAAGFSPLEI